MKMGANLLKNIVADKEKELFETKKKVSLEYLKKDVGRFLPRGFKKALDQKDVNLIAEIKKASPSRGIICEDFNYKDIACQYEKAGCQAISVLTEKKYFLGDINYLAEIRDTVELPLLRKDFIIDEYQVYESIVFGADAILLIARCLHKEKLKILLDLARELDLDCIVEVHNKEELNVALKEGAQIIGINNRNLEDFSVNLELSCSLAPMVPEHCIVVSESGIQTYEDIQRLKQAKIRNFLVGESLMSQKDINKAVRDLREGTGKK